MSVPRYWPMSSSLSSSPTPSSHASAVLVVFVAGSVVVIIAVVVVVGEWLSRVREVGGLADARQCREIAENGMDVTLI